MSFRIFIVCKDEGAKDIVPVLHRKREKNKLRLVVSALKTRHVTSDKNGLAILNGLAQLPRFILAVSRHVVVIVVVRAGARSLAAGREPSVLPCSPWAESAVPDGVTR